MVYVLSKDGLEFSTEEECKEHEDKLTEKTTSLRGKVKEIFDIYHSKCVSSQLSDKYLKDTNAKVVRRPLENIVGEYEYGIIYLRDDAVDTLFKYSQLPPPIKVGAYKSSS